MTILCIAHADTIEGRIVGITHGDTITLVDAAKRQHKIRLDGIPADWFDEPCWETGRNVWWRFRRGDGDPWGLAGLWNTWTDKATGEIVESDTMLTLNADAHPLMSRMHKPDAKLAADKQDKRSVVPIEPEDVDQWLAGTMAQAAQLVRLAPVEAFTAGPV